MLPRAHHVRAARCDATREKARRSSEMRRCWRDPRSSSAVAAAALTVIVTVAADLAAGSHLGNVAALGVLAVLIGVLRIRSAGRHRVRFSVLSALIALQPSLHATSGLAASSAGLHAADVDDLASFVQVGLAVLIVSAVGAAEAVLDLVAAGARSRLAVLGALLGDLVGGRWLLPTGERTLRWAEHRVPRPGRRIWRYDACRRGPPSVLRAA